MPYQPSLFDYDYSQGMPPRPSHWDPIPADQMNVGNLSSELPTIDTSNPQVNFAGFNFGNFGNNQNIDPYAGLSSGQQVFRDGIMGSGVGNQFADARQRMTSNDAYRGTFPGSPYSPHRGFEEMEFDETVTPERTNWLTKGGNFLKKFSPTGIINALPFRINVSTINILHS